MNRKRKWYISVDGEILIYSVGFWIPDGILSIRIVYGRVRYSYPNINGWSSFPFVGFEDAVDIIPAGTLVRVFSARWWTEMVKQKIDVHSSYRVGMTYH